MKYYEILGLELGANREDIRKAYLKMALRNHPDRHIDNKEHYTEKFKEISEAYDKLYNKEIDKSNSNPFEIFRNIFPKNIDIDKNTLDIIKGIYEKIIENNYNFNINLFFEMVELINKPNFKSKINNFFDESLSIKLTNNKAECLIINKYIDLKRQYESNNFELCISLKKRSKTRFPKLIEYVKKININLLDEHIILHNQGNYNLTDKYQGDIEVNILDKENDGYFKRYNDFDLIYTLYISKEDFFNEIYHVINHFKESMNIYINEPYKSYIYKIKNYGMIDYSDSYKGDLYIYIKVDLSINKSNLFFNDYVIPEIVNIFR